MDEILKFLDKVISVEDLLLKHKPRVSNTIGSFVKVFDAALAADLGDTERAFVSRGASIFHKAQDIVG